MAWVPIALAVAGAAQSASASSNAAKFNSQVAANENKVSVDQANAQEGLQRRAGREALGRQAAAFGAAGVGYGGSSETALDQSAINTEMDNLNTRYKGSLTGYGYNVQSGIDKNEGTQAGAQGGLLAGAALLKGMGTYYNMGPESAATMSGAATTTPSLSQ